MKKINSINYGGRIIGVSLIIMFIIPAILMLINTMLNYDAILLISVLLFIIGAVILSCFIVYLCIELYQDKKIDKYYGKHRNVNMNI